MSIERETPGGVDDEPVSVKDPENGSYVLREPVPDLEPGLTNSTSEESVISPEGAAYDLSPENDALLQETSEPGKGILKRAYEGIANISAVDRFGSKVGAAWNQVWANVHNEAATKIKDQVEGIDAEVQRLASEKDAASELITQMEQDGTPGLDAVKSRLSRIEADSVGQMKKRAAAAEKFEKRQAKQEIYQNKREDIINRYNERSNTIFSSVEGEVGKCEDILSEIGLKEAGVRARHETSVLELNTHKETRDKIVGMMERSGWLDKFRLKRGIAEIDKKITETESSMEQEVAALAEERTKAEEAIAKQKQKLDLAKEKRSIFDRSTDTKRSTPQMPDLPSASSDPDSDPGPVFTSSRVESLNPKQQELGKLLEAWNKYAKENSTDKKVSAVGEIEPKAFLEALKKADLESTSKISVDNFKNIIISYLKVQKIPVNERDMNELFRNAFDSSLTQ